MIITSKTSTDPKDEPSLTLSELNSKEIAELYEMLNMAPLPQKREFYSLTTYIKKNFVDTRLI
jgi:hypothetical protein